MSRISKGHALEIAVCDALGVDFRNVRRLVITLEAGHIPTIEIERFLTLTGEERTTEVFRLSEYRDKQLKKKFVYTDLSNVGIGE